MILTLIWATFLIVADNMQWDIPLDMLQSKFDHALSVNEKTLLVERFNGEDIVEFKRSVAKIEKRLIPALNKDIERIKKKLPKASESNQVELKADLKSIYKDRQLYLEAVIWYKQLVTWYEEWNEWILGEDYTQVQISSDESSVFFAWEDAK